VFELNVDGIESTQIRIRARAGETGRELKRLAENAAEHGARVMESLAPKRSGKLASRIGSSDAHFRPGGFGGGGHYEAEFGVSDRPGPERDLPFWVYHGTGIFADNLDLETSGIASSSLLHELPDEARDHVIHGNKKMRFHGDDGFVTVPYVLGQRPQKQWVEEAHDAARDYVAVRLSMFEGL
jgi:hypothetical protein